MLFVIVWIIMTIVVEIVYHKLFRVVYFGSRAMGKELMSCMAVAFILTGIILSPFA